eukprot:INCI13986.1.p1 GENE.INCI13986.1~~INCI13986.1.p1  ORF type:complete len:426 (-),score=74.93 INCI13986.1:3-1280(-)
MDQSQQQELQQQQQASPLLAGLRLVPVAGDAMISAIAALETSSYPPDEAATPEKLFYRATHAGDVFRVVVNSAAPTSSTTAATAEADAVHSTAQQQEVLGFVCGTLTKERTLTHESMDVHVPDGSSLCIHSVVTHPKVRRQGVATWMLRTYLTQLPAKIDLVLLMCKKPLIPLYEACGFTLVGVSPVVHGKTPWYEMKHTVVRKSKQGDEAVQKKAKVTSTDSNAQELGGRASGNGNNQGGASTQKRAFDVATADANKLPALAVFDLDACFWDEEMYTLDHLVDRSRPVIGSLGDGVGDGVVGARSGRSIIRIHPGALLALQGFYRGEYPGMRIAAASSADTPIAVKIGRSALALLEIVPGVTAREVFGIGWPAGFEGNLQIGRTPPLSANKAHTHFPILKRETKVQLSRFALPWFTCSDTFEKK